jgi:uncharacterized membrane protein YphA (DoxX/SURF4 family)
MRGGIWLASEGAWIARAALLRRLALGGVLVCFGIWELMAPAQWAGFVPPAVAARLPAVPAVLVHGWVLLMVGAALLLDYVTPVAAWLGVAIMVEVVTGLVWTSGFSTTLVRDVGLLALATGVAVDVAHGAATTSAGSREPAAHPAGRRQQARA